LGTVCLAGLAQAADLPTTKTPAPAPKPNCYASFWTWLNSSADDCPLSAYGITLYGTLDVGFGYQQWGAGYNPSVDKSLYGLNKAGHEHIWQPTYNGLSTSVVGLKLKEDLAALGLPGWAVVGVAEAGVNPYSGMLDNGPLSLASNNFYSANGISTITVNGKTYKIYNTWQNTNLDSSRAGQWDNSQGYIGVSNNTWGTLTFGRTNSLALDSLSKYDPMGGSAAFSQIGFSSSFPGFGNTELVRINTALTYKVAIPNVWAFSSVRLAGQAQIGGYNQGNGSNAAYYGQLGFDWGNFSFDGIAGWAKDAVSLSSYGGTLANCPNTTLAMQTFNIVPGYGCYNGNDIVKATLSNNFGTELMASYKWDRFRLYGGYIFANLSNPSDSYAGGFGTIANGIFVPPGAVTSNAYYNPFGGSGNVPLNGPAYAENKVLQTVWTGVRWSVPDDWMHGWGSLDLAAAVYYQWQNNYNYTWNTGYLNGAPYGFATQAYCAYSGAYIASVSTKGSVGALGSGSKCGGALDSVSVLADWKPVKRVDIYAGVMVQNVYGGLAAGYLNNTWVVNASTGKVYVFPIMHAFTTDWDPTIGIRVRI
jgi:predicted porin